MPALTLTYSNIILEFTMRATCISGLYHLTNLSTAPASSIRSCIANLTQGNKFALDSAMPACTSVWLLEQVHAHLDCLQHANSEIFLTNHFAAPAATIQAFVSGAIGIQLPLANQWMKAYYNNIEMCTIRDLVVNPSKINHQP
jgi:hypothetical protein